ncbi:MAG TPA: basic secretory protein-like protein [Steroidobacteraceae bacterium]|nr:basic secretory protein-like protein [Steroidobacteraceae bacterium]
MKKRALSMGLVLAPLLAVTACGGAGAGTSSNYQYVGPAQGAPPPDPPPPSSAPPPPPAATPTCETRDVYTLCTRQDLTIVPATMRNHMTEVFFDVYPRLVQRFNRGAPMMVTFVFNDNNTPGAALGNTVWYQAQWLNDHAEDYDIVVHEVMHLVEAYDFGLVPSWLTEGIADYARYHYGVNNAANHWSMTPPSPTTSYTLGYGTAARFLVWVEDKYDAHAVEELNAALRGGSYAPAMWMTMTGKDVNALWAEYLADTTWAPGPPQGHSN